MNLHEQSEIFRDAINYTAEKLNIVPAYIEKDYWVTFALYTLYQNQIREDVIFKGGTALAKCYKWIERFSEDIDLVIIRREGESDNKLKAKLKDISNLVEKTLPEIEQEGLTRKRGMIRKTAHSFEKHFGISYGQIRDTIVIESTWLGNSDPYTRGKVSSLIAETLLTNHQENLVKEFGLESFELQVLEPSRTFCEKIMSLVRFSYDERPIEALKNKIRHIYDLYCLLQRQEIQSFFHSADFEVLLKKVIKEDKESFKSNNHWLQYQLSDSLIFSDTENVWKELRGTYHGAFKNLVFGELPKEEEIINNLLAIKSKLEEIY